MSDAVIRLRIDPGLKKKAVRLFKRMGITTSDAVRLFLLRAVVEKRLPFEIQDPNEITIAAMQAAQKGKDLEVTSLEQIKNDWYEE
jgi:DNA-damage-inducible protein J